MVLNKSYSNSSKKRLSNLINWFIGFKTFKIIKKNSISSTISRKILNIIE